MTTDVSAALFRDISAVSALDEVVARPRRGGRSGYNAASAGLADRFGLHGKTGVEPGVMPQ